MKSRTKLLQTELKTKLRTIKQSKNNLLFQALVFIQTQVALSHLQVTPHERRFKLCHFLRPLPPGELLYKVLSGRLRS